MKNNFWDERYAQVEYVYGTEPNVFFKEILLTLPLGKLMLPAEGEGRNATFAAENGWEVSAFDISAEGKRKALELAHQNQVEIDYQIANVKEVDYRPYSFDALALIYTHFPEEKRREYHRKLASFLKTGGTLIIEGFSKNHSDFQTIDPAVGGPKDPTMLYDINELKADFPDFTFQAAFESIVELSEGEYHVGKSSVIRIIATKDKLERRGF